MPNIWFNVCEASGDMHGAHLMEAIRRLEPGAEFCGMAGPAMREVGLDAAYRAEDLSVMGFTEVFAKLPEILRLFGLIKRELKRRRPDAVVLIDSPDFNFRVARIAHKLGIPVYYYISPQIWAWRAGRARFVQKYMKRMICILPFEERFYRERGVEVSYVGHPLVETTRTPELLAIAPTPGRIGILPGSRGKEISSLMRPFCEAAQILWERDRTRTFVLPLAPGRTRESILAHRTGDFPLEIVGPQERYAVMRGCQALIAASGTVALEAALLETPTVVGYKLSALTFFLARIFISVPNISLPNLILGETVFPELLQEQVNGPEIAGRIEHWIDHPGNYAEVRAKLHGLAGKLGPQGAVDRAAAIVLGR